MDSLQKRALDVVGALAGLLILAPLFALIAVAVRADSPGPVLFRHRRIGRNRKPFWMLKFRTMVRDALYLGPEVTTANDPRVTRLGRLLRRTKLDELPQLVNVLLGQMSLVGPRPQSYSFLPFYKEEDLDVILSVRPGITGPTQLWLRHEEEILGMHDDPLTFYTGELLPRKIESDRRYATGRSMAADAGIVARTLKAVVSLRPADLPERVAEVSVPAVRSLEKVG
ncbi:MAG: sugar transferase [Armatimonadetes bacterium]|nr:sugar transferase [Armatimonadota bacterium]